MRVLIVEDEPIIALEIEGIVRGRLPDAEVVVVASVRAAMTAARRAVALALLDVDVADGKTYPLARQLLAAGSEVAFVSGARADDVPAELDDVVFIRKPFRGADIIGRIDALGR